MLHRLGVVFFSMGFDNFNGGCMASGSSPVEALIWNGGAVMSNTGVG